MQAAEQQILLHSAVSKYMPNLLGVLVPHMTDSTVQTALNSVAAGMRTFKAEAEPEKAHAVLPNLGAFIHALLPFMNSVLIDAMLLFKAKGSPCYVICFAWASELSPLQ